MVKKATQKTVLKSLLKERQCRVTLWLSEEERDRIRERSEAYANGNLSAWMRYASIHYEPPKDELVAAAG